MTPTFGQDSTDLETNRVRLGRLSALAWAVVLGWHMALPLTLSRWHSIIPDEDAYIMLATRVLTIGSYSLDVPIFHHAAGAPNTYFGPGWPFFMAVGYAAAGTMGIWLMLGLAWCLAAVGLDRLGRELQLGIAARWILQGWLAHGALVFVPHRNSRQHSSAGPVGSVGGGGDSRPLVAEGGAPDPYFNRHPAPKCPEQKKPCGAPTRGRAFVYLHGPARS